MKRENTGKEDVVEPAAEKGIPSKKSYWERKWDEEDWEWILRTNPITLWFKHHEGPLLSKLSEHQGVTAEELFVFVTTKEFSGEKIFFHTLEEVLTALTSLEQKKFIKSEVDAQGQKRYYLIEY